MLDLACGSLLMQFTTVASRSSEFNRLDYHLKTMAHMWSRWDQKGFCMSSFCNAQVVQQRIQRVYEQLSSNMEVGGFIVE